VSKPLVIGIVGSLARPSRTRILAEALVARAAEALAVEGAVFDMLDLQPSLGAAHSRAELATPAASILDAIAGADALVAASPVYKGSYTGLFKHLFDLIDPRELAGKPVILAATGGSERHALVLEHQFQPLFSFFGAHILPGGIYATAKDFDEYALGTALGERVAAAAWQLAGLRGISTRLQPA
jgi:FMN reductase